jgi:hypothetical protein
MRPVSTTQFLSMFASSLGSVSPAESVIAGASTNCPSAVLREKAITTSVANVNPVVVMDVSTGAESMILCTEEWSSVPIHQETISNDQSTKYLLAVSASRFFGTTGSSIEGEGRFQLFELASLAGR